MDLSRRKFLGSIGISIAALGITALSLVKASNAKDLSRVEAFSAYMKDEFNIDSIILDDEYVIMLNRKTIVHCCHNSESDASFLSRANGKRCNMCDKETPKEYVRLWKAMGNE